MARGAVPRWIASARMLELELEPRPDGITRTWPVMEASSWGWWWSVSRPVWGSMPPHRLRGASSTRAGPAASPATRARPWSSRRGPERVIADDPPLDGRLDAFAQAAEHDPDAEVPRRVPGPFGRAGHHHPGRVLQDRGHVGAGVDDQPHPGRLQRRQPAEGLDPGQDVAAGVGVERHLRVDGPAGEQGL